MANNKSFLRNIFYTIAVNYSHHAYLLDTDETEGHWMEGVFHKNDGYQTPLVINPFRDEGNIDMNNESDLMRSRLIANLLKTSPDGKYPFRYLSENREAVALSLKVNESKENLELYQLGESKQKVRVVDIYFPASNHQAIFRAFNIEFPPRKFVTHRLAFDYIKYKLISIALKYDEYKVFFDRESKKFDPKIFSKYIQALKRDHSHITFKLRQTLNFIHYGHFPIENQLLELNRLAADLKKRFSSRIVSRELIYHLPPPIFKTDVLYAVPGQGKLLQLRKLSSGEKQQIFSINSVLYHLLNLNSVNNSKNRFAYRHALVILEEIEMYFHPEMQRSFINLMLECIKHLSLSRIRSIQLCFVTHSPFILSDIPVNNILFLDDYGRPAKMKGIVQTFGGNILDLLAHGFFLNKGLMGEFARRKIQAVIEKIKHLKTSTPDAEIETIIALIGEPFLKQKLYSMYRAQMEKNRKTHRI